MKKYTLSVLGSIVLSASLLFVGCDERNDGQGVGKAPGDANRSAPAGPGGPANPANPDRPDKTKNP
jgi:hypothetical protein